MANFTGSKGKKLDFDDRPTVGDVIAITRQLIAEDRIEKRTWRFLVRLRYYDWRAWLFRQRLTVARIRGDEATALLRAELLRISAIVQELNQGRPREHQLRGKVRLPPGVHIIRGMPDAPEDVDVISTPSRRP
jgi:hypothetical protein